MGGGGGGGGGAYLRGEGVAYMLTSLNVSSGMGLSKEFYGVRQPKIKIHLLTVIKKSLLQKYFKLQPTSLSKMVKTWQIFQSMIFTNGINLEIQRRT